MKKKLTAAGMAVLMVGAGMLSSSCFGKYQLTRTFYTFHEGIMGDDLAGRFVRTLLLIPFSFVYWVTLLVDTVVLNLIEFWSGSNPLAMGPNDMEEQLVTYKGKNYKITATQNRFSFVELKDGEATHVGDLVFNAEKLSWNYEKEGEITELYKIKTQENGNHMIEYKDMNGNLAWESINSLEAQYQETLASK